MKIKSFDESDGSLMKDLKGLREKKVPPAYLKGFSESVERKILGRREKKGFGFQPGRFTVPVWVPVMAVLVLAVTLVVRGPFTEKTLSVTPGSVQLASATLSEEELSEEIALMAELGEWSDVDDSLLEPQDDALLEELEYSGARFPQNHLA